tara:strand:+ start:164 stop:454 length:291 start_codon:yes stop_codon:yes gene_type:complete
MVVLKVLVETADLEEAVLVVVVLVVVVLAVAIADQVAEVFVDLEAVISEVRDLAEEVAEIEIVVGQTAVREIEMEVLIVDQVQIDQGIEDVNTIFF